MKEYFFPIWKRQMIWNAKERSVPVGWFFKGKNNFTQNWTSSISYRDKWSVMNKIQSFFDAWGAECLKGHFKLSDSIHGQNTQKTVRMCSESASLMDTNTQNKPHIPPCASMICDCLWNTKAALTSQGWKCLRIRSVGCTTFIKNTLLNATALVTSK